MKSQILLLSAALLMSLQVSAAPEPVTPKFDERTWKVAYTKEAAGQRITEWLLPGQTVEDWQEMVTEIFLPSDNPKAEFGTYIEALRAKGVIAKIINQQDGEVVYQYKASNGQRTEYAVHRAFVGKTGIHSVQYATHDEKTFLANSEKWTKLLQGFTFKDS